MVRLILRVTSIGLAAFFIAAGCIAAQSTGAPSPLSTAGTAPADSPRLRGFNVPELNPKNLADMKTIWHANSVRYHIPISQIAQQRGISMAQAWQQVLKDLPAGLDAARANGIAVIIGMPQNGIFEENPKLTHDQNLPLFWQDDANRDMLISCWKDIAAITKGRRQEIWFDIFNEPLDRAVLPAFPPKWPQWSQQIIDAIRVIEPQRPIVVEPGPGSMGWGFQNFPLMKGGNIIYSFHSYSPHVYTHQGISSLAQTDLAQAYLKTGLGWPGDFGGNWGRWDKNTLETEFAPVVAFQKRNPGIRIYVGEFGVVRWAPNAEDYLRDSIGLFEKYGWDWSYHAFREYTGWSLEHNETYSQPQDAQLADHLTARGAVVLGFMKKNDAPVAPVAVPTSPDVANPYRILFVGDSITMHGTNPDVLRDLKWDHASGMAASKLENDYCHRLVALIQAGFPNRTVQIAYPVIASNFADSIKQYGLQSAGQYAATIQSSESLHPNLVVIQLGEHERVEDGLDGTRANYEKLFDAFNTWSPRPALLCTGVWQPQDPLPGGPLCYRDRPADLDRIVSELCKQHNIPFVSVASLAMDPTCRGWGEISGVQWHPNDKGHQGYAARLFDAYQTLPKPAN